MTGDEPFLRLAQSAEDGTMPLLSACILAENGDFYDPRWGIFGNAIKKKYDKHDSGEANCKTVWEKCEEAVGKFEID